MLKSFNLSILQNVRSVAVRSYSTARTTHNLLRRIANAQEAIKGTNSMIEIEEAKQASLAKMRMEKEREEAFKPYKGVNGFSYFIKDRKSGDMGESSAAWKALEEHERSHWNALAADFTAKETALKFPPPPEAPRSNYLAFLKEQHPLVNASSFGDKSLIISERWRKLSAQEKDSYKPSEAAKKAYAQAMLDWEELRLKSYRERREEINDGKREASKKRRAAKSALKGL